MNLTMPSSSLRSTLLFTHILLYSYYICDIGKIPLFIWLLNNSISLIFILIFIFQIKKKYVIPTSRYLS